ncbi:MAG: FAD-dependent oxidoreductase, partial [Planctomycetes bacterium]|nr:FAD-dependent oxidoreductase [Planctomycetota bacterium]
PPPPHGGARATRRNGWRGVAAAPLAALVAPVRGGAGRAEPAPRAAAPPPPPPRAPRIAIVGAGLAGLVCAHVLQRGGIACTLYEGASRVGGRVLTARDRWGGSAAVELGGEFIDSGHRVLRHLAQDCGLALDDLVELTAGLEAERWWFQGRLLSEAEIVRLFKPVAERIVAALAREEDPAFFAEVDQQSIIAWLEANGADPLLVSLLDEAYTGEYGLPASEQSAWNLLWLIDAKQPQPFRVYGDSDERYHLRSGNDALVKALSSRLGAEALRLQHRLTAVRARGDELQLEFAVAGSAQTAVVDYAVLAIPFTTLREVALEIELPAEQRQMIAELGYGTNAKVIGAFREPLWRTRHRASGNFFADGGMQEFWDPGYGQALPGGMLTHFAGGATGLRMCEVSPEQWMRERLALIDAVFPGAAAAYVPDQAIAMHWPRVPWAKGSYACYRVGQARWSGSEGQRAGRVFFAGEHTSVDFQGYMEGAAESGWRAANEILADLGRSEVPLPA